MNTNIGNKTFSSTWMEMERLEVGDAVIEYQVKGIGEPVLLIHLSLVADGLVRPLLAQPELAARYQLIHYYRRGYMGSTLGSEPLSISRLARDAAALLKHLGVKSTHAVGHSIGGDIALQLAVDAPGLVHSFALLEPPLRMVPSGKAVFERVNLPMLNAYRSGNKQQAIEIFGDNIFGPDWKTIIEREIPGGVEQAVKNFDLFIREQPLLQEWQFGPQQAALIKQPVLSVVGAHSQRFMFDGRELLHTWFPQAEDFDAQSTHLLQLQDPVGVAHGLAEFFSRHPMA